MIYHAAPQGSQAWLDARKGVITASRFKDCRARLKGGQPDKKCIGYAQDTARQRVGGTVPEVYVNAAMRFGSEQEPLARMAYEHRTGYLVEEVGFMTTDDRMFGVSLDGAIDDDGILEVKTLVSSDTLFTALGGDISAYIDQCNGALWLTGRKWVDLVLWAPDLKDIGAHLTIIRINRDEEAIQALEDDLVKFAAMVNEYEALLRRVASAPAIAAAPAIAVPAAPAPAADWRAEFRQTA
jgi:exodeoxyribonuclease (lambda-induced)